MAGNAQSNLRCCRFGAFGRTVDPRETNSVGARLQAQQCNLPTCGFDHSHLASVQTQFDFGRGHRNDIVCHIARNAATKFETEVLLLYSTLVIVLRVLAGIRLFCSKNRIDSLADIRPVNSSRTQPDARSALSCRNPNFPAGENGGEAASRHDVTPVTAGSTRLRQCHSGELNAPCAADVCMLRSAGSHFGTRRRQSHPGLSHCRFDRRFLGCPRRRLDYRCGRNRYCEKSH